MFVNPWLNRIKDLSDLIPLSKLAEPSLKILKENMVFDSGHDEAHLLRVVRNALWFAEAEEIPELDVLIPAALLHDLMNLPKDSPLRSQASKLSADAALEGLSDLCDLSFTDGLKISHAIQAHSFSANILPKSIEAKAIQDADRVDALGYIGLARLFSVGGSLDRQLFHPLDPLAENRKLDENKYTLDHFYTKLIKLPETMQTELGRKVANAKVGIMLDFVESLKCEISGKIVTRK